MPDPVADRLLLDVQATTRQSAIDGLTLAQVFDDLRLVLDLQRSEELPAAVLRAAALVWAETQQTLSGAGPYDGVRCVLLDDVESHLWSALGSDPTAPPTPILAVVVRARPATGAETGLRLREVDLLVAAARSVAETLDGPGEYVALVRDPGARLPDQLLALVTDRDRAGLAAVQASALPPPGGPTLTPVVHDLRAHTDGVLAALRAALAPAAG